MRSINEIYCSSWQKHFAVFKSVSVGRSSEMRAECWRIQYGLCERCVRLILQSFDSHKYNNSDEAKTTSTVAFRRWNTHMRAITVIHAHGVAIPWGKSGECVHSKSSILAALAALQWNRCCVHCHCTVHFNAPKKFLSALHQHNRYY